MSHLLGTLWFVLLVGGLSFAAGAIMRPKLAKWIPGLGGCCKKG